jgi:hypothetical protein
MKGEINMEKKTIMHFIHQTIKHILDINKDGQINWQDAWLLINKIVGSINNE